MRVRENALLQKDEVIGKGKLRWVVGKRIGDGGFAEVYEGQDKADPEKKYAIKIERYKMKEGGAAKREISVLRDIELKALVKLQACPQVVRLVKGGLAQHNQHVFIVMERLGLNLADLRRTLPGNRFQPDKVKAYGVSMLHALEGVHRGGYIHRDVKPANFALSANPEEAGTVYVLDFGVARRYLDEQGQVLPMRTDYHQFRGSTTYASVNALNRVDLGRRDDLWSWLYMLVEMLNGSLPWRTERSGVTDSEQESPEDRKENDKRATLQQKQHCIAHPEDLTTHVALPDALRSISGYLEQLSFEAEPDYNALRLQLEGLVLPEQPQATWPADPAANGQHAGWAGNGHAVHAQQGAAWPQQYDPHMQAHWQYGVAGHPLHGHHIPPGGMPNGLPMPLGVSDTPLSPPEEDVGHHLYAAQHYQTAPAGSGEDDRPGLKRQRSERERSYDGDYVRPSGRDQPPTRSRLGREDSRGTYSPSRGEAHLDRRDRDRRETPDPRDPRDHRDRDHRDHRDHRDGRDERYRDDDRDRSRRDRDRDRDRSDRRDDRGRSREYERGRDSRSGRSTGREGDEGLKAIQQLVRNFRDGKDISSRAQRAKESLKSVDPVEAVSVVGWLLDAMVTHLKPAEMSQVGGLLDDLLPFVKDLSSRSWSKYGER
ncbi:hypothetical protein WJX72_003406 [[Myrmecia] bisecta]|uniref:Protein kinase domain-containing protein n=1 Tax=[Myrmecia] bisecta TaxID=41462 RepID=A0AAW1QAG9_9CHLO